MLNQKGFAPILIVLAVVVLAAIAGGAYYLRTQKVPVQNTSISKTSLAQSSTPPTDQTANWKTYSNSKYGFLINYPGDWIASQATEDSSSIGFDNTDPKLRINAGINIYPISWTKTGWQDTSTPPPYKDTTFNGVPARSRSWEAKQTLHAGESIEFLRNGYYYSIDISWWDQSGGNSATYKEEVDSIYQKILSNFKFTDSAADQTVNWKTYNSKDGIYSFKYPSEFSIEEEVGGGGQLYYVNLISPDEKFRFESGPLYFAADFDNNKSNKTENFNSLYWTVIDSSKGYCDAGNCGQAIPGYYITKSDSYVGVLEIKIKEKSLTLKKILSTFQLSKNP